MSSSAIEIDWRGVLRYGEGLALQERMVADRIAGATGDRVLLLEHPAVVTLGRSTDPANLRLSADEMRNEGIEVFEVGRGGDVTYHALGQLVGYPILDLADQGRKDVHVHLRRIESALMEAVESFGIPCRRVEGRTGVFIDRARSVVSEGPDRKIASIGVGVRKWVTFHGFALNVSVDLAGFEAIVPCGLHDVEMTSVSRELEREGRAADSIDASVRNAVGAALVRWLGPEPPTCD